MTDTIPNGYYFDRAEFAELLLRTRFPERTERESGVLLAYCVEFIHLYDRVGFSVRVGKGLDPDPTHLPGVQANTTYSTRKRIDMLAMKGPQPVIIEVKDRVTPASLGQILTYRHLYLEEFPDALDPELVIVGRFSDPDTLRAITSAGVPVVLYAGENPP